MKSGTCGFLKLRCKSLCKLRPNSEFTVEIVGKVDDESKAASQPVKEDITPAAAAPSTAPIGDETEAHVPNPFDFSAMAGLLNVCTAVHFGSTDFSCHVLLEIYSLASDRFQKYILMFFKITLYGKAAILYLFSQHQL
jgi:hypothetical protein